VSSISFAAHTILGAHTSPPIVLKLILHQNKPVNTTDRSEVRKRAAAAWRASPGPTAAAGGALASHSHRVGRQNAKCQGKEQRGTEKRGGGCGLVREHSTVPRCRFGQGSGLGAAASACSRCGGDVSRATRFKNQVKGFSFPFHLCFCAVPQI